MNEQCIAVLTLFDGCPGGFIAHNLLRRAMRFLWLMLLPLSTTVVSIEAMTEASAQSSHYVVDGIALGARVRLESEAYKSYECSLSEKFAGFTWCHREERKRTKRAEVLSANSILHANDGTTLYVNRYVEPAFFKPNDVRSKIDRLSSKFGERAREIWMPPREGLPRAVIAIWGKIELEQLDPVAVATVAAGGREKGLLVSFLGDLQRSAKAQVPLYRLSGGAGFLWAATFNQKGRGVLRFLTVDASQLGPFIAQNPPSASRVLGNQSRTAESRLPAGDMIPANRRAAGEFARFTAIPNVCQSARDGTLTGGGARVMDCPAVVSCLGTLKSQSTTAIEYLKNNPAVLDAFNRPVTPMLGRTLFNRLQQMAGEAVNPQEYCGTLFYRLTSSGRWLDAFKSFSDAGQALLAQVRSDYTPVEIESRELIAFNDRYSGVDAFERAYTAYRHAFEDDDIAGMIRERPGVLQGLEQARARKQLLTQQSVQIAQDQQTLDDIATAIDREGLTSFADQQTQTSLRELRSGLARLSQTAPGKRGDISSNLEIFATRIQGIDTAIRSARSTKAQAEQTRLMLVEREVAAKRVLDAASSEELKGAFDDEFRNSINELINRSRELEFERPMGHQHKAGGH